VGVVAVIRHNVAPSAMVVVVVVVVVPVIAAGLMFVRQVSER
jgi:hypothetical protein